MTKLTNFFFINLLAPFIALRVVRRLRGGHYEKWLFLGHEVVYRWVEVKNCYYKTGLKPHPTAHLTLVCETHKPFSKKA